MIFISIFMFFQKEADISDSKMKKWLHWWLKKFNVLSKDMIYSQEFIAESEKILKFI